MHIEVMDLHQLAPAEYNPRTISEAAYRGLKRSLDRYGCVVPLVWNRRTGTLISGHQRLRALLDLGETQAEVAVLDLDEAEEKALNLTLNNPAIAGEFTADVHDILLELQMLLPEACVDLRLGEISELDAAALKAQFQADPAEELAKIDEFSGKQTTCPHCGETFRVGSA